MKKCDVVFAWELKPQSFWVKLRHEFFGHSWERKMTLPCDLRDAEDYIGRRITPIIKKMEGSDV